jgi:hypothetical protein
MPNRRLIFTYIAVLLFFNSAPLFAQATYEAEPFNGGFTSPIWFVSPSNLAVQWVPDGKGNQALRLEACTSSSAANHCDGSGSSYGQLVANSTSTQVHGVYRTTTSGTGYVTVGTTSALSFTDHTVKAGTTYYYVVTRWRTAFRAPTPRKSKSRSACEGYSQPRFSMNALIGT